MRREIDLRFQGSKDGTQVYNDLKFFGYSLLRTSRLGNSSSRTGTVGISHFEAVGRSHFDRNKRNYSATIELFGEFDESNFTKKLLSKLTGLRYIITDDRMGGED